MNDSQNEDNNIPIPKDSETENVENTQESVNKINQENQENNDNKENANKDQDNNEEQNNPQIEENDNFNNNNEFPSIDEDNSDHKDNNEKDINNDNNNNDNINENDLNDNNDNNNNNNYNNDNGNISFDGNNNNFNNNNDDKNDNNNFNVDEKIDESSNFGKNNKILFSSVKPDDINRNSDINNNNEPSGFDYDEENPNNSHGNETNNNLNLDDDNKENGDFGFRENNNSGFDNHDYEKDFDFGNNQNNFTNNNNLNNNNNNNITNAQKNNQENNNNINNQNNFKNNNFNYNSNPYSSSNTKDNNNYGQNNTNQTTTVFIPQETPIFNNLNNNNYSITRNQEDTHPDYDPQYKQYIEFPEDSDGTNLDPNKKGKDSTKTAGAQIANTIMGAGILAIPIIMRYLGILIGTLIIVFLALSTIYSVYILIRCHEITGKYGFSMLGKITMGNFGNILIKIIIIINNIGLCIAYFRIFGEVLQTIIQAWVSPDSFWATNWHNYIFILMCGVIMIFFIFIKNISALKKVAYLGVLAVLLFSLSLSVLLIYKSGYNYLDHEITWKYLLPNCTFSEAFHVIPTVFLAFLFQFNVFPIYLSLKHRNIDSMMKATKYGVIYSLIIFLIVGIVGFLIYGLNMEETILNSLSDDMLRYGKISTFIKVLIIIICITFVTTCLTSFPILFLSLRENFANSMLFCFKNCCKKNNEEEVQISQGKYEKKQHINRKVMGAVTIILYFIVLGLAIVLPKLKIIFSVVGATAGTFIAFILPSLFYIRICKMSGKSYNIVLPIIFFAIGLFFLIVSLTVTFI